MNDKVTAVHTAPASIPAKDIPVTAPIAQPAKVEETKAEPAVAMATKS
jgi:hypothetical protein